jgi:tetratricopeptide (TPR) repeat protein
MVFAWKKGQTAWKNTIVHRVNHSYRGATSDMADLTAMYDEADRLKDEKKYDEAIEKLNAVLAEDENHVLAHLALAVVYGRVNKHEDAVRHGQRACEIEPEEAFNYTAMSVTYQRAFAGTQNQEYIRLAEEAMAQANALQYRQQMG